MYVQEPNPSNGLVKMVNFIIKWYAVMYFNILMKPNVIFAAKHFFDTIVLARDCLSVADFKFVQKYFTINSYMAHPESILLGMLFDKSTEIRQKAVDVIIGKTHALKNMTYSLKILAAFGTVGQKL